jgi:hypothetical protein
MLLRWYKALFETQNHSLRIFYELANLSSEVPIIWEKFYPMQICLNNRVTLFCQHLNILKLTCVGQYGVPPCAL